MPAVCGKPRIERYIGMAKQEYLEKNRQWLRDRSQEPGVLPLDKGIFYKVITNGDPKRPSPGRNSVVTVHYTGKTINGRTFDSSRSGVLRHSACATLYPAGSLPCSRCTRATDGKSISPQNRHMAA